MVEHNSWPGDEVGCQIFGSHPTKKLESFAIPVAKNLNKMKEDAIPDSNTAFANPKAVTGPQCPGALRRTIASAAKQ